MTETGMTKDRIHKGDFSLEELAKDATEHCSTDPFGVLVVEEVEVESRSTNRKSKRNRKAGQK